MAACGSAGQSSTAQTAVPAIEPAAARGPSVWSVDVMTVRAGERENYRRFLEANWARARRTARERSEIRSYQALFSPDTAGTRAGTVLLMTEYPDSAAYARREEIFQPILAAQGRTLIDGKATRELTDRVENYVYVGVFGGR